MNNADRKMVFAGGFLSAGLSCGLKKSGREDMAVIFSERMATASAVFTKNRMAAAPVLVSREVAIKGRARAIVCNSKYANACTGKQGMSDAGEMARIAADELGIPTDEVFVCSTGVIAEFLPMDTVRNGIIAAINTLGKDRAENAAKAIMTTDTFAKYASREPEIGGKKIMIAGIAKGSGMIHPNMATMLCFITTDADIEKEALDKALRDAVDSTFNMITVDGDTSTNDSVIILANGAAGNTPIGDCPGGDYREFAAALEAVCRDLARLIVLDGEGATKFLEISVKGAFTADEAKDAAMAVANSPLVKTAFFGCDANWGRILSAVGNSNARFDQDGISLKLDDVNVVSGGIGLGVDECVLAEVMKKKEIKVTVDLQMGKSEATVWTCDLSYDYIRINGDYRT